MMSLIPAVWAVAAVAALWFYELDETTVDTMGRELAQRRQAGLLPRDSSPAAAVDMPPQPSASHAAPG
jgi:Na+/melibiose symporter-like transporter